MVSIMNFLSKFTHSSLKQTDQAGATPETAWQVEPEKLSWMRCLIFLVLLLPVSGWNRVIVKPVSQLEKIRQQGELRFVSHYGPGTYYNTAHGVAGLEHDLAGLFARRLGVAVRFLINDPDGPVDRLIASGKADVAGGVFFNASHGFPLRFGPVYRRVTEQVLYGAGHSPPANLAELGETGVLQVAAGNEHIATLRALRQQVSGLNWRINPELDVDELSELAGLGKVDYILTDSDRSLFLRHTHPGLQLAFDVGESHPVAWALLKSEDVSLYVEMQRFFAGIRADGQLEQLMDRYFGHTEDMSGDLDTALRRDYHKRLPRFKHWFIQAGRRYGLDWRLLAAVAYQESRWVREAVSPEGVRGLMMLTEDTARELKVRDRTDPATSIMAAAAYLRQTLANISEDIPEPDRTWYALAAYNLGYAHIEEARDLVERKGRDPDKWIEIKKVLPKLGTLPRHGRREGQNKRGEVTVNYVTHIRRCYDLLVWLTEQNGKPPGFTRL